MKILCSAEAKYLDGYIIDYDMINNMSLEDIENSILRLAKDEYICFQVKRDIMEFYLKERKYKLDKRFQYTKEELKRLGQVNDLIARQTSEVMHLAHQIYLDEEEIFYDCQKEYTQFEVEAYLDVPRDISSLDFPEIEKVSYREAELWAILSSKKLNHSLNVFKVLGTEGTFSPYETENGDIDIEKKIEQTLYLTSEDKIVKDKGWGCVMEHVDTKKLKDICIVRPLHNLFDYCCFSFYDILKIKRFDYNIEISYDND